MTQKPKIPTVAHNVDLPLDLSRMMDGFCAKFGVKKKAVTELALRQFFISKGYKIEPRKDQ